MDTDRTARLTAFHTFRGIVEELRGVKLHPAEADELIWAAEGMLLATSALDDEVKACQLAFDALQAELAEHRWADLTPTADRLRKAFAECGPRELSTLAA
jgi:hypothetical protein